MRTPDKPDNEAQRLQALKDLNVLDTEAQERFDRYTRLACRLFGVPIALVSLVDENRQWFKSKQGLGASETPRDISFCGHAILQSETFVIENALEDERFSDNPLVTGDPNIRFYAGHPLQSPCGAPLGTLCLIDNEPRELSAEDQEALQDIAAMVAGELASLRMASTDDLTGLSNRRGFETLVRQALAMCQRTDQPASLVLLDLDGMKEINDQLGHNAGDEALKAFAGLLMETFRDSDVVARLGGDEFVALLAGTALERAEIALGRLRYAIDLHNRSPSAPFRLEFSAGVAEWTPEQRLEALLEDADARMYSEKKAKKAPRRTG